MVKERCPVDVIVGAKDAERVAIIDRAQDSVQGEKLGNDGEVESCRQSFCPYESGRERQRRPAAESASDVSRGQEEGDPKNIHCFRKGFHIGVGGG